MAVVVVVAAAAVADISGHLAVAEAASGHFHPAAVDIAVADHHHLVADIAVVAAAVVVAAVAPRVEPACAAGTGAWSVASGASVAGPTYGARAPAPR